MVIALMFSVAVIKVWRLLSSKRMFFKKNVASMVFKLVFNALNILDTILVGIKFVSLLGGLFPGVSDIDTWSEFNENVAMLMKYNLSKEVILFISFTMTTGYLWHLIGLESD